MARPWKGRRGGEPVSREFESLSVRQFPVVDGFEGMATNPRADHDRQGLRWVGGVWLNAAALKAAGPPNQRFHGFKSCTHRQGYEFWGVV